MESDFLHPRLVRCIPFDKTLKYCNPTFILHDEEKLIELRPEIFQSISVHHGKSCQDFSEIAFSMLGRKAGVWARVVVQFRRKEDPRTWKVQEAHEIRGVIRTWGQGALVGSQELRKYPERVYWNSDWCGWVPAWYCMLPLEADCCCFCWFCNHRRVCGSRMKIFFGPWVVGRRPAWSSQRSIPPGQISTNSLCTVLG